MDILRSFCRQCIDESISSGELRCPACTREGKQTMLGQMAFLDRRLQTDPVLWDIIRKIFPRKKLELELEQQRQASFDHLPCPPSRSSELCCAAYPSVKMTGTQVHMHVQNDKIIITLFQPPRADEVILRNGFTGVKLQALRANRAT